ncbi:hypothetical protein FACS18945_5200 [Bacteroidia bacterium]|nr:hypothetical protein FACS18945_5200 [Bacteroidia bacterium]
MENPIAETPAIEKNLSQETVEPIEIVPDDKSMLDETIPPKESQEQIKPEGKPKKKRGLFKAGAVTLAGIGVWGVASYGLSGDKNKGNDKDDPNTDKNPISVVDTVPPAKTDTVKIIVMPPVKSDSIAKAPIDTAVSKGSVDLSKYKAAFVAKSPEQTLAEIRKINNAESLAKMTDAEKAEMYSAAATSHAMAGDAENSKRNYAESSRRYGLAIANLAEMAKYSTDPEIKVRKNKLTKKQNDATGKVITKTKNGKGPR